MILASVDTSSLASSVGGRITLDDLFRYAVAQRRDEIALIDPPNRADFTSGAPRALTFGEADRIVTGIAARLRELGLQLDHVVGLQMPNTVEGILALLGILRAGLIASPLPLLWRRADCAAAMTMIGARALITTNRVGAADLCQLAMDTASEAFTIRHVCTFGGGSDGVISFEDLMTPAAPVPFVPIDRGALAAAHVAIVTWDIDPVGLLPIARSHVEVLTAGFEIMLEGRFDARTTILSSFCLGSMAGIATTITAWLLSRGTLVLHHPFDPTTLRHQIVEHRCRAAIVPGSLATRFAEAGMFRHGVLDKVVAIWRSPERLATCPVWPAAAPPLMDVTAFGEIGLFAAMRGEEGKPLGLKPGPLGRRRPDAEAPVLIEAMRSPTGTLALRGPMVPLHSFPPGSGDHLGNPRLAIDEDGFVDTYYPCRLAPSSGSLIVTGPPAGLVSVGGYRFMISALQEAVSRIEPAAMIAAFPDGLTGQRIAGIAARREDVQEALRQHGFGPLVVNAFRPRRISESRNAA